MNDSKNLVSINILSYNRKDSLRVTLKKIYEQDYKNIEVIVVDNCSTDGTAEMVLEDYPHVILIRTDKNLGTPGWNKGFEIAEGNYIMVLDDDSYPEGNVISRGICELEKDDRIGAVTFNVYNNKANKSETADFMEHPYFFHGCGTIIRKEVVKKIGKFNEFIFIYYHELDYSARIYDEGYTINYLSNLNIIHNQSNSSRGLLVDGDDPFKSEYRYRNYFLSYSIFVLQRFSWYYNIIYLSKWILNRLIICVANSYYGAFIKVIFFLLVNTKKILKGRKVLSRETQKFYKYGNEALIDRTYFPNYRKPRLFI